MVSRCCWNEALGAGRILLLATRLDNAWTNLPVQPVFVNFVAEAAGYLSGADRLERQQTAGTLLALQQSGSASGQVIDPQGNTRPDPGRHAAGG